MRTAIFIPVRLDSVRLPQKALLDIWGKPAILCLIDGLRLARLPELIVVCTSVEESDNPLCDLINEAGGIRVFRGSKDDLLDRYRQAALTFDVDLIVNVDGDDLLVDAEQVDEVAAALQRTNADVVKYDGLPFGAAPMGIRASALAEVCRLKQSDHTATGWGAFFNDANRFRITTIQTEDENLRHPEIRMTLDYPEDYEFFKAIFAALPRPVRLRDAIRLILDRPDIIALNAGLEERYWAHFNANLPGLTQLSE